MLNLHETRSQCKDLLLALCARSHFFLQVSNNFNNFNTPTAPSITSSTTDWLLNLGATSHVTNNFNNLASSYTCRDPLAMVLVYASTTWFHALSPFSLSLSIYLLLYIFLNPQEISLVSPDYYMKIYSYSCLLRTSTPRRFFIKFILLMVSFLAPLFPFNSTTNLHGNSSFDRPLTWTTSSSFSSNHFRSH